MSCRMSSEVESEADEKPPVSEESDTKALAATLPYTSEQDRYFPLPLPFLRVRGVASRDATHRDQRNSGSSRLQEQESTRESIRTNKCWNNRTDQATTRFLFVVTGRAVEFIRSHGFTIMYNNDGMTVV
jgi:hypothetical protein